MCLAVVLGTIRRCWRGESTSAIKPCSFRERSPGCPPCFYSVRDVDRQLRHRYRRGIFAPLLVLGGLLGLLIGELSQSIFPAAVPEPNAFAMVGMGAVFASVVRCPLTGIVLIIEMTGHYELILPLMVASFTAAIVADELRVAPVYDALLESQLSA